VLGEVLGFHNEIFVGCLGSECCVFGGVVHEVWARFHSWVVDSNSFGIFTPNLADESHFDWHIFQLGWFNH